MHTRGLAPVMHTWGLASIMHIHAYLGLEPLLCLKTYLLRMSFFLKPLDRRNPLPALLLPRLPEFLSTLVG